MRIQTFLHVHKLSPATWLELIHKAQEEFQGLQGQSIVHNARTIDKYSNEVMRHSIINQYGFSLN